MALAVTDLKRIIAYSTMSQIGYMILGVSTGGYEGGLFHLMTHAFFKALLFMAAGSVIGAMAGIQNIDRMGGFRKAMPFTFATFTVGALALAGFAPLSGWFSKDDILGFDVHRGGYDLVLAIVAFAAALLTAFYSFRMVFRVFYGDAVPEAASLEQGELAHGEHVNPLSGEHEDTDVGFPGPEHHIAEREWPMKVAMGTLALLAIVGGVVAIPGVTHWFHNFIAPTFADSKYFDDDPSTSAEWVGLVVGAGIALAGITTAFVVYLQRPGTTAQADRALPARARLPRRPLVLRRALRRALRPAHRHASAASAATWWRARSCRARWWAARRESCGPAARSPAACSRATCAPTRCCCSRAWRAWPSTS